ncbi:hypothetical protein PGT21_030792 [Puccinia graminis f. sp. tritici]|uniref:Uncharacterized protein n=1 Tax=Puccinia graminis f. sp. tritici TaxID=56615 RepID=A0A5B0MNU7_PUCGR|nr:hypothetical protein PGT21_014935 [Puccinia graminis f. sp. tritici]KAA1110752.1 hypothetical protein PGT21_030792 [Puccinia graminis f. sp. tritici]
MKPRHSVRHDSITSLSDLIDNDPSISILSETKTGPPIVVSTTLAVFSLSLTSSLTSFPNLVSNDYATLVSIPTPSYYLRSKLLFQ